MGLPEIRGQAWQAIVTHLFYLPFSSLDKTSTVFLLFLFPRHHPFTTLLNPAFSGYLPPNPPGDSSIRGVLPSSQQQHCQPQAFASLHYLVSHQLLQDPPSGSLQFSVKSCNSSLILLKRNSRCCAIPFPYWHYVFFPSLYPLLGTSPFRLWLEPVIAGCYVMTPVYTVIS